MHRRLDQHVDQDVDQHVDQHGPVPRGGPGRAPVRAGVGVAARGGVRAPVAVGLTVLAGVAYLGLTDPYRPGPHLACPVLALTGLYCAGCGGQRAVHDLAHGDLAGAWAMNPLVVLAAPVAVAAWLRWLVRRARGTRGGPRARAGGTASPLLTLLPTRPPTRLPTPLPTRPRTELLSRVAPWALAPAVVGFAVLRNVPALAPWLAP